MAKAETDISNRIRIAMSALGARVFRNHRGKHLTLDAKRVVVTGLAPGSGDLIGWVPVLVTPAMVGKTVAVFASIEVKTARGHMSDAQDDWLNAVNSAGGIAIVAFSTEDAERLVRLNVDAIQARVRIHIGA